MNIKVYRKKLKITQSDLAAKMNVTQGAIVQWESGICFPRADKLPMLANILNCSIEELIMPEVMLSSTAKLH
ncbi:helix-turn-helix domain-containing protein [Pectinatus brassicae]|uniref:Transcriptional regulator with XRE-family HTH domain n=1 Tax=Pectinatus brassicae TaxID=862415 RepID=A0A840UMB2_9FIRM|nr:helix-turn-helix transcriptional regulator [Pectinatus brassicae]MBB5335392.1 transcriptional regulator with XRE-family HTH domain [Pectinatus brassicae]